MQADRNDSFSFRSGKINEEEAGDDDADADECITPFFFVFLLSVDKHTAEDGDDDRGLTDGVGHRETERGLGQEQRDVASGPDES